MLLVKLGVNIDHIATLRQARRELFPDVLEAARAALSGGADGIVVHLREDRRHIRDDDVYALRKSVPRLDLEMAVNEEIKQIALRVKPDIITLVPEKREEVTTEGGLDAKAKLPELKPFVKTLQDAGIIVSLFIDPVPDQIKASAESGAKFIEIHTGLYANARTQEEKKKRLKEVQAAVKLAETLGLKVNAGHGLTLDNVGPIASIKEIEELNIGFSIIARAVFVGLEEAVREMKAAIRQRI
ncbi:MAG: pyridoxine 5'-phosphate synthase [bacterium]